MEIHGQLSDKQKQGLALFYLTLQLTVLVVSEATVQELPSLLASAITLAADLLITCTTHRGQFTAPAMVTALSVASASTASGRLSSWPSGPVIPKANIFFAP